MAQGDHDPRLPLATLCEQLCYALRGASEGYLRDARLEDALRLIDSDVVKLIVDELSVEGLVRVRLQHARVLRYMGAPNNDHAQLDAALALVGEAEKAARLLGHPSLLADVLHLRGTLLYDKEVWATALEPALLCFEEALTLRQASDDLRGIAEGLFGIGIVFQNKIGATEDGQRKAFECFQESYRLAEQGGYASERAHAARHLAYLWTRRGDSDRALAYNLEFLKVNEELGFKPVLPPAYTMVGFAHLMRNQLDEAARCFETARLLAERAGYKRYLAEALFGMGATSEERGENDAALSCYEQALSLAQSTNFQKVGELAAAKIDAILHDKGTT